MQPFLTQSDMVDRDQVLKNYSLLIGKVWGDPAFKAKLMADPAGVLKEHGFKVPEGVEVKILEDTEKTLHMSIPFNGSIELSDSQLDHISGGGTSTSSTSATVPSCLSSVSTAC